MNWQIFRWSFWNFQQTFFGTWKVQKTGFQEAVGKQRLPKWPTKLNSGIPNLEFEPESPKMVRIEKKYEDKIFFQNVFFVEKSRDVLKTGAIFCIWTSGIAVFSTFEAKSSKSDPTGQLCLQFSQTCRAQTFLKLRKTRFWGFKKLFYQLWSFISDYL